jgi:hypothetical protein
MFMNEYSQILFKYNMYIHTLVGTRANCTANASDVLCIDEYIHIYV